MNSLLKEKINEIIQFNSLKNLIVIGCPCSGKTTLVEMLKESKIYPLNIMESVMEYITKNEFDMIKRGYEFEGSTVGDMAHLAASFSILLTQMGKFEKFNEDCIFDGGIIQSFIFSEIYKDRLSLNAISEYPQKFLDCFFDSYTIIFIDISKSRLRENYKKRMEDGLVKDMHFTHLIAQSLRVSFKDYYIENLLGRVISLNDKYFE